MTASPDLLIVPPERQAQEASVSSQLDSDPLGEVLGSVKLTGALFFVVDATSPWCIEVPHTRHYAHMVLPKAQHLLSYHITVEGAGFASVPGIEPVAYDSGDIVLFPQGDGYKMQNAPETPPEFNSEETLEFMRALGQGALPFVIKEGGGGPPRTTTICGFLGCDSRPFNPMLASLPRLLRLRRPRKDGPDLLDRLIDLTMAEAQAGQPGSRDVALRLGELMFVELLRRYVEAPGPKPPGWLSALRDPALARVMGALHARPEESWTVDSMAREAGLSRTVLAERFTQNVGQPPLRYLTLWRMQMAAALLTGGGLTVAEIAQRVGYGSESAFSRTFKRTAGLAPNDWRRKQAS